MSLPRRALRFGRAEHEAAIRTLRSTQLSENPPEEDEVYLLAQRTGPSAEVVRQNIPFIELPAEIRNRIYELALPESDEELIVATPFKDTAMTFATQPALTRTCRLVRSEMLPMFYAKSTFVAYVKDSDFTEMTEWCRLMDRCLPTHAPLPPVHVHIHLLSQITCVYQLLHLTEQWRNIGQSTIGISIHYLTFRRDNCSHAERMLITKAVLLAKMLRVEGSFEELVLLERFREGFTPAGSGSSRFDSYGCWSRAGSKSCSKHGEI